jgi:hypothetical protein
VQRCGARWSCGGAGVGRAVSTLRCLPHACRQSSETCYARLCHGLRHIRVNCWRMFCACARAHSRLRVCARLCVCPRACMRLLARARARTWCCVTHRDAVCTWRENTVLCAHSTWAQATHRDAVRTWRCVRSVTGIIGGATRRPLLRDCEMQRRHWSVSAPWLAWMQ